MNDEARTHPDGAADAEELLGAYVLDALDDDERERVEAFLARDPAARAEVARLREVAALLAPDGPQDEEFAADAVWAAIVSAVEDVPPVDLAGAVRARGPARRRPWWRVPLAAAVLVAVATAGVAAGMLAAGGPGRDPGAGDVAAAAAEALADPATVRVPLVGDDGAPAGTVVVRADGTGYLVDPAFAPLRSGRTYQLWALGGEAAPPVSVAVLGARPRPAVFRVAGAVRKFAVSVEDAPGATAPTLPPVASGEAA